MFRVLFVYHGNICRSPMAEFVLKSMIESAFINSVSTSCEEIGNPIHPITIQILQKYKIPYNQYKRAIQLKKEDYNEYDLILCMDQRNVKNTMCILNDDSRQIVFRLLDFSSYPRDISDPWYTHDFELTYRDILEGCTSIVKFAKEKGLLV